MRRTLSLLSASILTVSLAACSPSDRPGDSSASSSSASSIASSVSSAMVQKTSQSAAMQPSSVKPAEPSGSVRIITVAVDNFDFSPSVIKVKKGEKVTLVFKGEAGAHGVMIKDLGINVVVPVDGTVTVDLPTDTAGTFAFRCSIPCGAGHKDMKGTIIIE